MFRLIGAAFLAAILASFITDGNQTIIGVAFFGTLAVLVAPILMGTSALRCPHCRKRVKLGATACHHCGRQVGTTA